MFCLSCIPYGVVGSLGGPVMQYKTSSAGIDVDVVSWYQALLFIPPMVQFVYAPIVDVGPKRKHWLLIVSAISAACVVAAMMMPLPEHTGAFLGFALAAQLVSGLVSACNGGLMAVTLPDSQRGQAGAWYNIGNSTGNALGLALAIWLTGADVAPEWIGVALGALTFLPALAILAVDEPPRDNIARIRDVFGTVFHDVGVVVKSRSGVTGILLCLSPVGTAALINAFSGPIAKDFQASDGLNGFINGPATALLSAVGAGVCGWLCMRHNRRGMYLASGVMTALVAVAMAVSPLTSTTFAWGGMLYQLVAGFCYAAFTATVLETIGTAGKAASTQFSLFLASGNAAIAYTQLIDGNMHRPFGVRGMLGTDAALNLFGVVALGLVFWRLHMLRKFAQSRPTTSTH